MIIKKGFQKCQYLQSTINPQIFFPSAASKKAVIMNPSMSISIPLKGNRSSHQRMNNVFVRVLPEFNQDHKFYTAAFVSQYEQVLLI